MDFNASQLESIVRKVLGEMGTSSASAGEIPKTGKVAMLTAQKTIEVKEFAIPELEDDILTFRKDGESIYYNLFRNNVSANVM